MTDGSPGDVVNGEALESCDSLVAICGIYNFEGKYFLSSEKDLVF